MQPLTEPGQRHLLNQIVRFSQSLRHAGLPVNSSGLIDLCRSMSFIEISERLDFYATVRTTLISSHQDIAVFNQVFSEFWYHPEALSNVMHDSLEESEKEASAEEEKEQETRIDGALEEEDPGRQSGPDKSVLAYSPDEALLQKDFDQMSDQEIEQARRLIAALVAILANYQSRRRIVSRKGTELNLRKMLRQNALYAQDATALLYRKKRIKKIKLLLLCDVSGSMERYSRFLIQFIYALRRQLASFDVAVFSTRMTVITDFLKWQSVEQSLGEVAANVHDWGGGTNIGSSLREFNDRFGRDAIRSHTVAIILSDGWDRGDAALMREEMQSLHDRVHRLLWLNPLLGDANYQPLCKGIQTALPFIDQFLPAHNLESFAQLIRHLRTAWR
ncbi:MAG: VWA domain-containing protein [Calditrichaeota bacterium]|nr:VWA domain-containing protein [Calditrichota bacterium]